MPDLRHGGMTPKLEAAARDGDEQVRLRELWEDAKRWRRPLRGASHIIRQRGQRRWRAEKEQDSE